MEYHRVSRHCCRPNWDALPQYDIAGKVRVSVSSITHYLSIHGVHDRCHNLQQRGHGSITGDHVFLYDSDNTTHFWSVQSTFFPRLNHGDCDIEYIEVYLAERDVHWDVETEHVEFRGNLNIWPFEPIVIALDPERYEEHDNPRMSSTVIRERCFSNLFGAYHYDKLNKPHFVCRC